MPIKVERVENGFLIHYRVKTHAMYPPVDRTLYAATANEVVQKVAEIMGVKLT